MNKTYVNVKCQGCGKKMNTGTSKVYAVNEYMPGAIEPFNTTTLCEDCYKELE